MSYADLPHYTYENYKQWEGKWELIGGIAYAMSPAPMIKHQRVSNNIAWLLQEELKECESCEALLPIDWKISEDTIVQPDNLVVYNEDMKKAYITKSPVMIFEVLSKSTAKKDEGLKFELYETEGVLYYIIVNPDDEVSKVYHLKDGRYIKLKDTTDDKIKFKFQECEIEIDFSKLWS